MPVTVNTEYNGPAAKRKIAAGARKGVVTALTQLRRNAVALAPVDTTALRNSAAWELLGDQGDRVEGMVTFDTPYAVYVHEITGRKHPVGQDHFLSEPLETGQQQIARILAAGVRRELS